MSKPTNMQRLISQRTFLAAVSIFLCALCLTSNAWARFSGSPPYVVPAAAFNLDGTSGSDYFFGFTGYISPVGASVACMTAPVLLPDGIMVDRLNLFAFDNHASANISVSLRRKGYAATASTQTMATVITTGQSTFIQTVTTSSFTNATIDNRNYAYHLDTCFEGGASNSLRIQAVSIDATVIFANGFESP